MYVTDLLQLHTQRLQLRRLRSEDADAICAYRDLPQVARYQSWEDFGAEEANQLIADQLIVMPGATGSWLHLMIIITKSGQPIGDCGIHFPSNAARQVELGITLDLRYQNRGFACEAIEGVLSHEFASSICIAYRQLRMQKQVRSESISTTRFPAGSLFC